MRLPFNCHMDNWQHYVEVQYQKELEARRFYDIPECSKRHFYEHNLAQLMHNFEECLIEGEIL